MGPCESRLEVEPGKRKKALVATTALSELCNWHSSSSKSQVHPTFTDCWKLLFSYWKDVRLSSLNSWIQPRKSGHVRPWKFSRLYSQNPGQTEGNHTEFYISAPKKFCKFFSVVLGGTRSCCLNCIQRSVCERERQRQKGRACSVIYPVREPLWQTDPSSWLTMLTVAEKKKKLLNWTKPFQIGSDGKDRDPEWGSKMPELITPRYSHSIVTVSPACVKYWPSIPLPVGKPKAVWNWQCPQNTILARVASKRTLFVRIFNS